MRTITAMYDNKTDAEEARTELAAMGVPNDCVTIHDQQSVGQSSSAGTSEQTSGGLWESFKSMFSDDHDTYSEGMRRGGYLLTARVEEAQADAAIDILDDDGTVDLEERSADWRNEGWTGGSTATAYDRDNDNDTVGEQRIPMVEERLDVGKREVSRGGVRVRSYVTEQPVHEDVTLREEHVNVERHPVSGNYDGNAADLLQERTIEVSETAEEAVVNKTAQVREEFVVNKTVDERVERIDDTVRRTEVDVERTGGDMRATDTDRTRKSY